MATAIREFRALGTYVHLQTEADPDLARRRAVEILDAVDLACSRFREDSDLSRLNRAQGTWTRVSPLLLAALEVALAVAAETDGLVDPCLGRPLIELGYDADFRTVRTRTHRDPVATSGRPQAWTEIEVADGAARIPSDVSLDLGATAKAWASDVIAESLVAEFGAPVLVSLGGDVRIAAPLGQERPWLIQVTEHPDGHGDTRPAQLVTLDGGGLATSSTRVRRWRAGSTRMHHLIDPRTGRPAQGPWRTVTATGPTCTAANAATTAALVRQESALTWLTEHHVDARLVGLGGDVQCCGQWPVEPEEDTCSPR